MKLFHCIFPILCIFPKIQAFHISPPISSTPPNFQHKQHIVCESIIPMNKYSEVVKVSNLYAPSLTENIRYMNIPSMDVMNEIIDENETDDVKYSLKIHSKYHELRYETTYKNKMSYARYCYLEERLGMISRAYVMDQVQHWCLFMDPSLLYHDSILGFWPKYTFKHILMITTSHSLAYPDLVIWEENDNRIL